MVFDTHSHYYDDKFGETREERDAILEEVLSGGVSGVINCGTTYENSLECIRIAEKFGGAYAACGLHPEDVTDDYAFNDESVGKIKALLSHKKVVALGEIGLDYHWREDNKDEQKRIFRLQLEIAVEEDIPVVVHDRDAHGDTLSIVSEYKGVKGVFHSYSGSIETAKELMKMGWYISFSGVITFKNAVRMAEIVKSIPDDRILIETDCPYLAPHPHRGERNDSRLILFTAEKAAELRNLPVDRLISQTNENAKRLFTKIK